MSIPETLRSSIRDRLWDEADQLYWASLSAGDKTKQYTIWTETPSIGGRLAAFMDPRQVRVYIKDTLLKAYTRARMADPARVFRVLGLPPDTPWVEEYIEPHGRRLADGRLVCLEQGNGVEGDPSLLFTSVLLGLPEPAPSPPCCSRRLPNTPIPDHAPSSKTPPKDSG